MAKAEAPPSTRSEVKRLPARGAYDRRTIDAILDEGFVCHVGFAIDGQPYVIPTAYVRAGDCLYVHGSSASRMIRTAAEVIDVCVTVTLVDGFVLGRSAFHHSLNYRSVVVFGQARLVSDPAERLDALRRFTNHVVPGRWEEVRRPNDQELKATAVLAVPLAEVSAKIRKGPPIDDEADYSLAVWAGVIPIRFTLADPVPDERLDETAPRFDRRRLERGHRA